MASDTSTYSPSTPAFAADTLHHAGLKFDALRSGLLIRATTVDEIEEPAWSGISIFSASVEMLDAMHVLFKLRKTPSQYLVDLHPDMAFNNIFLEACAGENRIVQRLFTGRTDLVRVSKRSV